MAPSKAPKEITVVERERMRLISLVPTGTKINFLQFRKIAAVLSLVLCVASAGLFFVKGLNFGIDFRGGILIEVRTEGPANMSQLRDSLGGLGLGEVQLQEFGQPTDVLIRIERQPGGEKAQLLAVETAKRALGTDVDYRRTEFVGPKVGGELIEAGITAVLLALTAMLVYIWFRFEWQFGVGAVVALLHDVLLTIGIFALLGLEFNLSTVAAILTIAGYSINDTVVVYDRVRENLRKFKQMALPDLLNLSINATLSRTLLTSITTLLALMALYLFGGEVLRGFSFAMIWGVLVGTYSSIFIAVPLLVYMKLRRSGLIVGDTDDDDAAEAGKSPS
jgi:preprotein translocase subunit SecF